MTLFADAVCSVTMPRMATVGDRVREAMTARGIGNNELDRRLGKKQGYTSTLLRDVKRSPRGENLSRLAEALGVTVTWLLEGKGSMDPQPGERVVEYEEPTGGAELGNSVAWKVGVAAAQARWPSRYTGDELARTWALLGASLPTFIDADVVRGAVELVREIDAAKARGDSPEMAAARARVQAQLLADEAAVAKKTSGSPGGTGSSGNRPGDTPKPPNSKPKSAKR